MGLQHRISRTKYEQLKKFTARPLDVVITVMATVGRVCVLPEHLETAIITKHCYRISPPDAFVNSHYLAFALRAEASTRRHIFGNIRGQTRAGINGSILKVAPVALPPLAEQFEIVSEVQRRLVAADRLESSLHGQIERARATRQSLLREAFAGKLVSQDPKEEPASLLLSRIREAREAGSQSTRRQKKRRQDTKPVVTAKQSLLQLIKRRYGNRTFTFDSLRKQVQEADYENLKNELFALVGSAGPGGIPALEMNFNAKRERIEFKLSSL